MKKYTQILRVHKGIDFVYYELESGLVNGIKLLMIVISVSYVLSWWF